MTTKITARKKIAAAALALGAGVLGTGFAAGVITFDQSAQHGFGTGATGGVSQSTQMLDITGQLTIERPITAGTNGTSDAAGASPYKAEQGQFINVAGFEEIAAEHPGATYRVSVSNNGIEWNEVATGDVAADTVVQVNPASAGPEGTQNVRHIAVAIEK